MLQILSFRILLTKLLGGGKKKRLFIPCFLLCVLLRPGQLFRFISGFAEKLLVFLTVMVESLISDSRRNVECNIQSVLGWLSEHSNTAL